MKRNLRGRKARPLTPASPPAKQSEAARERSDGERGQSLLEVLIALSASVSILGAITVVVISSLSNTQFTKNQNLANQYAREGIEVTRKVRDSSWIGFAAYSSGNYCLSQGSAVLPLSPLAVGSACPQNVGIFVREISIGHSSADCPNTISNGSKVTSRTSWSDGKCPAGNYCHKVALTTCFHNVNTKTAP